MVYATPHTIEELELLFSCVPPQTLRKRINDIFFHYLATTPPEVLPQDFQQLSEDISFLIKFLDKVEKVNPPKNKE